MNYVYVHVNRKFSIYPGSLGNTQVSKLVAIWLTTTHSEN